MVDASLKCWIFGNDATTGEHKTKRSDLRAVFGKPTQETPLFYHDKSVKNRRVGLDAKILKSPGRICANCNNVRTQPHDRAWEKLSNALRTRHPIVAPGVNVRTNKIFPYNSGREMLNVHLYFVKLFGCHIVAHDIAIDIKGFSQAILNEKAHPSVFLKFGTHRDERTGSSNIWTSVPSSDGSTSFATWYYWIGKLGVNVMFAVEGEKRQGLLGAWHPRSGSNKLAIADFQFGTPPPGAGV